MRNQPLVLVGIALCLAIGMSDALMAADTGRSITTNKDKLLTLAVQGKIAPAEPSRGYTTTWDGVPKMMIGIGGINYNVKIGDYVFGHANADRATVGVAAVGAGDGAFNDAWLNYTSIGNEIRVTDGEAKGDKGVVVGKFQGYVLVHFKADTLDKLAIGDTIQAKARGVGLEVNDFDDVYAHSVTPEILEKIVTQTPDGKLEVGVVKEIPAEIVGQGPGRTALSSNYHIQTCYPPDIKDNGLNELRYGDLVLLKDHQTDFGKGYFQGGSTLGVVVSGPSDISGLGIGVTAILSNRQGKLVGRIDPAANIGNLLGMTVETSTPPTVDTTLDYKVPDPSTRPTVLKTNKDKLLKVAVEGVVQPARSRGYRTTWTGAPKLSLGSATINYTVSLGDLAYGWANADHVEPDVTIQGRDRPRASDCALAILACIGNYAKVVSGEAKGAEGIFIGRHAGSDDLVWFPKEVLENLALNDRIMVKAEGVGLKIEGFEDVRVNKASPKLLENMGIAIENGQLVVPIVTAVPGHIMGSGMGGSFLEPVDYDIQTTCPKTVEQYKLKELRLGDIVAIEDHYDFWGRGRYKGAVTVGVVIHGWSDSAGHGPGVNPLLSAKPGVIKTTRDPHANTAYYLGIRQKPASGNE
jgi:hypothetical protein